MTYSVNNQPRLRDQDIGVGPREWIYSSADPMATVDGSGYFTDGYALGMRDGDFCYVHDKTNKILSCHWVNVTGTTVDLSNGTTIATNATNSD